MANEFERIVNTIRTGSSAKAPRQLLNTSSSPVLRFGVSSGEVRREQRIQRRLIGGLAVLFVVVGVIHFINPFVGLAYWGVIGPVIAALVVGLLLWPTSPRVDVELDSEQKRARLGEDQDWRPAAQFQLVVSSSDTASVSQAGAGDWSISIRSGSETGRIVCTMASEADAIKVVAELNDLMGFTPIPAEARS